MKKKTGPRVSGQPHKLRINISLSEEAYQRLHEIAQRLGMSASAWIERQIATARIKS